MTNSTDTSRRKIYEANAAILNTYEHNFIDLPKFDDLPVIDRAKEMTLPITELSMINKLCPDNAVLAVNIFSPADIGTIIKRTFNKSWLNGDRKPLYLVWLDDIYYEYLQTYDFRPVIESGRLVFFDSFKNAAAFDRFFLDAQSVFPGKLVGDLKLCDEIRAHLTALSQAKDCEHHRRYHNGRSKTGARLD